MAARLYTIPGSHPGAAVGAMLAYKGLEHRRTDLLPVISKLVVRAVGFPGTCARRSTPARRARWRGA